ALQENKDEQKEKPEETKEEDLNKKLEELVQQLQEMEQSAAASIYAYTLYQQKQEQAKIETFYQQETKKI
ncbi:42824_t:CDS:2, partial [Gigaspora margarita]